MICTSFGFGCCCNGCHHRPWRRRRQTIHKYAGWPKNHFLSHSISPHGTCVDFNQRINRRKKKTGNFFEYSYGNQERFTVDDLLAFHMSWQIVPQQKKRKEKRFVRLLVATENPFLFEAPSTSRHIRDNGYNSWPISHCSLFLRCIRKSLNNSHSVRQYSKREQPYVICVESLGICCLHLHKFKYRLNKSYIAIAYRSCSLNSMSGKRNIIGI